MHMALKRKVDGVMATHTLLVAALERAMLSQVNELHRLVVLHKMVCGGFVATSNGCHITLQENVEIRPPRAQPFESSDTFSTTISSRP